MYLYDGQKIIYLFRGDTMNNKFKSSSKDTLFKCILELETVDECYAFFNDICTMNELKSLSQRLEVTRMLKQGKTYTEIVENTGASSATISRVNRSLNYGTGGFSLVLNRIEREQ